MGRRRADPEVGARVAADIVTYEARGGSLTALAGRLSIGTSAVSKLKGGQPPGPILLRRVAHEFNRSTDFYLTGKERTPTVVSSQYDSRPVPLVGFAAAGEPMARILEKQDFEWWDFPAPLLSAMYPSKLDRDRMMVIRVEGDSMEGVFAPGTLVFIDKGPGGEGLAVVNNKDVYLVRPPDEEGVTLKRVRFKGSGSSRTLVLLPTWRSMMKEEDDFDIQTYPIPAGTKIQSIVRGRVVGKFELVGNIGKVM